MPIVPTLTTANHQYIKTMETIEVKGELLFTLTSKQDWINKIPRHLPDKTRGGEQWIWIDKNGNNFECGADFTAAEDNDTYPCKVYRLCPISTINTSTNKEKA